MKVLLNEDIEKLGEMGDIIDVKPGYARNYLFPKKMAVTVNQHNLDLIRLQRKKIEKKLEIEKLSAVEQKDKLEEITLEIKKKAGENEVLFGSVTVAEIEKKLEELGVEIDRKKIQIKEPIKKLGSHSITIKLFKEVDAELKIEVVKEGEEVSESETP